MRLLIADTDFDYLSMLARSVRESELKDKLFVSIVTDPGQWPEVDGFDRFDAVLAGEPFFAKATGAAGDIVVMLWSETKERQGDDLIPRIFKYQPVGHMLGEVIGAYERENGTALHKPESSADCRKIAVYSASGGSGKTTVAQGLSELLAATGYRVFYLNMESVPGHFGPSNRDERKFCRLLYHLRGQEREHIRSLWYRDADRGFLTFPTADHYNEWKEYEREDIRSLFGFMAATGEFDCIVADLEHVLSEQTVGAIESCSDLLWLARDDAVSRYKAEYVRMELQNRFAEHLSKVLRPAASPSFGVNTAPSVFAPYMKLLGLEAK